jgi:predicted transposase
MKAILVNETENDKNVIDNMMLLFCSAIRYSFKRQLEGIKISELEKIVSDKYNLNIRQAKDAVESARQTIQSQKDLISNKEWKDCRNNRFYSRGDKSKCGNPNLRVIIKDNMSFFEISTLEKTKTNRAIKIQVPIYLPQKLSKKTGKINGILI